MSFLKKYKKYQEGVVISGTTPKMQEFFKTKPTEKQIMLLDDLNEQTTAWVILGLVVYMLLGFLIGITI